MHDDIVQIDQHPLAITLAFQPHGAEPAGPGAFHHPIGDRAHGLVPARASLRSRAAALLDRYESLISGGRAEIMDSEHVSDVIADMRAAVEPWSDRINFTPAEPSLEDVFICRSAVAPVAGVAAAEKPLTGVLS